MGLRWRARSWLLVASTATVVLAVPPRDLEPRAPYVQNQHPLDYVERPGAPLEYRPGRPRLDQEPRPPPPEHAYWYWLKEREAWEEGLPDPWFLEGTRRSGGLMPQPGVALGEAWKLTNPRHPERAAPRDIARSRSTRFPPARLSPDPGFRTDDPSYHFLPWDRRSDLSRMQGKDRPRSACEGLAPWQTLEADEAPAPPAAPRTRRDAGPGDEGAARMRRLGRSLFEKPQGTCGQSCLSCHTGPGSLRGIFPRYPGYDGTVNRVIGLDERVNLCRSRHQGRPGLPAESPSLLALVLHLRELE